MRTIQQSQHRFKPSEILSRGASHLLCSDCGLSQEAEPHRLWRDFDNGTIKHIPLDLLGSEYFIEGAQ